MAKGPERLVRWIMGHTQPVPYSLDIEHPAMDDIAWAADEIERLQAELRADMARIVALEQQNEALASRLDSIRGLYRDAVKHGEKLGDFAGFLGAIGAVLDGTAERISNG